MLMQWKSLVSKLALVLLASSLLTACGFHLRGAQDVPQAMQQVTLKSGNASRELVSNLTKALQYNGISQSSNAPYQIQLLNSRYKRRAASLKNSDDVDEYEISLSVQFVITDGQGKPLTADINLERERTYTYNEDAGTASSEQESLLRRELHEGMAQAIIRRYLASQPQR